MGPLNRFLGDPLVERAIDVDGCRVSREFNFRLGSYVVRIVVPDGSSVEVKQTSADKRHHTIYAEPETIYALVEGVPAKIPGAPGD